MQETSSVTQDEMRTVYETASQLGRKLLNIAQERGRMVPWKYITRDRLPRADVQTVTKADPGDALDAKQVRDTLTAVICLTLITAVEINTREAESSGEHGDQILEDEDSLTALLQVVRAGRKMMEDLIVQEPKMAEKIIAEVRKGYPHDTQRARFNEVNWAQVHFAAAESRLIRAIEIIAGYLGH